MISWLYALIYLLVGAVVAVIIFYVIDLVFQSISPPWYPKVRPLLLAIVGLVFMIFLLSVIVPGGFDGVRLRP